MNCRYVQSRLSAYLDMELTGHEHQLIRSHIENCIECSTEFERLRRTKHLLRQLPVVQSSQGPEAVLVRLRAQRATVSQNAVIRVGWRSVRWWQMAVGAAAIGVFLWWNSTVAETPSDVTFASSTPKPLLFRSSSEPSLFRMRSPLPSEMLNPVPFNQPVFSTPILPTNYYPAHNSVPSFEGLYHTFYFQSR